MHHTLESGFPYFDSGYPLQVKIIRNIYDSEKEHNSTPGHLECVESKQALHGKFGDHGSW